MLCVGLQILGFNTQICFSIEYSYISRYRNEQRDCGFYSSFRRCIILSSYSSFISLYFRILLNKFIYIFYRMSRDKPAQSLYEFKDTFIFLFVKTSLRTQYHRVIGRNTVKNTFILLLKIYTTLGYIVSQILLISSNQKLCISSITKCFTKRLQSRPLK